MPNLKYGLFFFLLLELLWFQLVHVRVHLSVCVCVLIHFKITNKNPSGNSGLILFRP